MPRTSTPPPQGRSTEQELSSDLESQDSGVPFSAPLRLTLLGVLLFCIVYLGIATARLSVGVKRMRAQVTASASDPQAFSDIDAGQMLAESNYQVVAESRSATNQPRTVVIFLGTDRCTFCGAAWDAWSRTLASSKLAPVELWYVSYDGSARPEVVRRLGEQMGGWRHLSVQDRTAFTTLTGNTIVPAAYMIDARQSVRCVVAGVPGFDSAEQCIKRSVGDDNGAAFFTFSASLEGINRR